MTRIRIPELHQLFIASSGISTDTRKLIPDSIFFALKGEHFNGNEYASKALESGCKFAVVDEEKFAVSPNYLLVENVLKTLQDLANYHRKQFNIPVIGITGSNGKTTTKELIGSVLSTTYNTLITEGNLNNHLGVPFTLLKLNMDHEIAIIEMGASKPGDIQELSEIAEPTHGIITNIGAAHIEGFGSLQGVINTKTELYRFIENTEGTLFCNADDTTLTSKIPAGIQVVYYGLNRGDIKGEVVSLNPQLHFRWHEKDYVSPEIKTHLIGKYNITNFVAAVSIGRYFEIDPEIINGALSSYVPSNKRSQIEKGKRNTLLVDCYNANATSMMAALDNFVAIPHERKVAILGDMLELGEISEIEHQKIADYLSDKNIAVYLIGSEFFKTNSSFTKFKTVEELLAQNNLNQWSDGLILVKGSRGIKLEQVLDSL
jgi:UDP-N-acetylmuramoyl-tripeptide--D-alanyl-D-alanine ligase